MTSALLRRGISRGASCLQLAGGALQQVNLVASSSAATSCENSFSTLAAALRRRESREAETSSSPSLKPSRRSIAEDTFQLRATQHLLNLEKPAEFYPQARSFRRRVVLHIGPTNSGKTHSALKAFLASPSGVYCSPLRLLAWEVAERINGQHVACDLLTGQEHAEVPGATHLACTVEMADLTRPVDVAVIDEIHLLGDPSRGWSFTRALLGLPAREIHLCGEPSALELVARLVAEADDSLEVHHYQRLSPLLVEKKPLMKFEQGVKGDAFIAFSRRDIHALRSTLEDATGELCAMVYGGLPPETRSSQAKLFNDPKEGYHLLAASDAIGMGLNLNIRRVVFSTMEKFDGSAVRDLTFSEIKQIAGRAGRFRSVFPEGRVAAMDARDIELIRAALASPSAPLLTAGLFPSVEQLATFVHADPAEGLPGALRAFRDRAKTSEYYFMRDCQDMLAIAELLNPLELHLADQLTLCMAPADPNDPASAGCLLQFARSLRARGSVEVTLVNVPSLITPDSEDDLKRLEEAHRNLDLYLWLARRMPDRFPDLLIATATRGAVAVCIDEGLRKLSRPARKTHVRAIKRAVKTGRQRVEEAAEAVRVAVEKAQAERLELRKRLSWRHADLAGQRKAAVATAASGAGQGSSPFLGGREADPWVAADP